MHPIISDNTDGIYSPYMIKEGVYIEVHFSARSVMQFIKVVVEECYKLPASAFSVSVIADDAEDETEDDE